MAGTTFLYRKPLSENVKLNKQKAMPGSLVDETGGSQDLIGVVKWTYFWVMSITLFYHNVGEYVGHQSRQRQLTTQD